MKQEDIKFCQEHIINFDSVKLGFTRNIPFDVLGQYERMYREYLDAQFHLTYWCGECVFDMLKRLITYYEQSLIAQQEVQSQDITALTEVQSQEVTLQEEKITISVTTNGATEYPIEKKKKGRPKKNG
jgi:hypothetical protein